MPLLIRELNIKINVDAPSSTQAESPGAAGSASREDQAALSRKVLDELLRIQSLKKER